jgi:signal transduction histidine kinase
LAAAGVALDWRIDESVDSVQLGSEEALQVMRILQEAATNIVKHSQASHMSLAARVDPGPGGRRVLRIEIEDDGVGLPAGAARPGARGLKNMHYRAGQIGAELAITGREIPKTGCRVALSLPTG